MGGRSLSIEQDQKLQRARLFHYDFSSSVASPTLPPIAAAYPPSDFYSLTPSPSPLPPPSEHHELPTAAAVGGGIAGVVALAATATIASTIAGKLGLSCLFKPIGKIVLFLLEILLGSLRAGIQRKSKGCTDRRRHRSRKGRKSNHGAGADDVRSERSTSDWETVSDGSPTRASKEGHAPTSMISPRQSGEEMDDEGVKRRKLVHDGEGMRTEVAGALALPKQELIFRDTGGGTTNIPLADGTVISTPTDKKVIRPGNEVLSPMKAQRAQDVAKSKSRTEKRKRKRYSNLGHVHLTCNMSAHHLRFFTACKSGGVYDSPMASPDHTYPSNDQHHHGDNSQHDEDNITVHNLHKGKHVNANHQMYVPMHDLPQNGSMHRQLYHPSKSILVQQNSQTASTSNATRYNVSLSMNPLESHGNREFSNRSSKPFGIDDYGGPLDGFL